MNTEGLLNWIETHRSVLVWAGFFSLITVVITAVSVPFIINLLSEDYFVREKRRSSLKTPSQYVFFTVTMVFKNLIGVLLFFSGFLMLFVPGQGLITIFISLLFIDYPGKWKLQKTVVRNRKIYSVLNWIRRKGGKKEFRIPGENIL